MKRLFTSLIVSLAALPMLAQGWPEKYDGVMLQGFYWNSYIDTNWATLESQADEMSQFFDLIWVPNSAYANATTMNMGYHPVYWFDHHSAFGTEAQLRSMIKAFKAKGTGIIEDVVINHRASVDDDWLNFPRETYKGKEYQLTAADICQDDESKDKGFKPTGAKDTGGKWGGARDLDHTSKNVQDNVKAYLDLLINDLGYVGFRYDYVLGYDPKYVTLYNQYAKPRFSVGECWGDDTYNDIIKWLNGTKVDGVIQSAAFDFPMKFAINDAFSNGGNWSKLNNSALCTDNNLARYAVTFVDNHDTGPGADKPSAPLYANTEAANAFILTLPGTPCVWLRHWQAFKVAIKKQILIRKAAGIHNQSEIISKTASSNGFVLNVQGTNGNVLLLLGSATASTSGYKLALEGTNYKMYVSNSVDISVLDDIHEDTFVAPDFCVVNEGEICAFYEAPASWTTVKCWAWDGNNNYTGGSWPGQLCTKVGTNNGKNVWKWTYTGTLTTKPTFIIFNDGKQNNADQTSDLPFLNGGYYSEAGALQGVVTGIESVTVTRPAADDSYVYDLSGRRLSRPSGKGIYIVNGKKYVK